VADAVTITAIGLASIASTELCFGAFALVVRQFGIELLQ